MKNKLILSLSLALSFNVLALETFTGDELLDSFSEDERCAFEATLAEYGVDEEFVRGISLEVDEVTSTASLKTSAASANQHAWLMSVGAGYFFPIGPSINFQIQPGLPNTRLVLDAASTLRFGRGSVQTYSATAFYKFGKSGITAGPVFQTVQISNPLLAGQKNFFYRAYGLSVGGELQPTLLNKKWTMQVYGQATLGGLNDTMVPFVIFGAGTRINLNLNQ